MQLTTNRCDCGEFLGYVGRGRKRLQCGQPVCVLARRRKIYAMRPAHALEALENNAYSVIVADPPWSFSDKGSRIAPEGTKAGYQTESIDWIAGLPVESLATENAHLYLWTTDAHLPDAIEVLSAWGFRYVQTLVWVKITHSGKPRIGAGHYFRHAHELVLFGVRGRAVPSDHSLPSVIMRPRGDHSVKPDELLRWAERLALPGRKLELFARRRREGWDAFGNQAPENPESRPVPAVGDCVSVSHR